MANVGEGGRDSYPIALDDRSLAELYFPPFRAALAAGSRSVMTAYNSVGGLPTTQNPHLLTEMLRQAWGFQGFVITDAAATGGATVLHHTASATQEAARQAFEAGVDVIFQSAWPQYLPYLDAVRNVVPPAVTDSAVARVLRAKAGAGLFANPYGNPDSAAYWNGHPTHRALAREAAAAAMVLLRNTGVLPIDARVPSMAVIGTDAAEARLGGYTAPGATAVSILAGLTARLGGHVRYAPGPGRSSAAYAPVPTGRAALTAEYFGNPDLGGAPAAVRRDSAWTSAGALRAPAPGLGTDWYSVRWSGTLTAGPDRVTRLGVDGTDGWRLWLDGRLLLDAWEKRSAGARLAEAHSPRGARTPSGSSTMKRRKRSVPPGVGTATTTGAAGIDSAVALAAGAPWPSWWQESRRGSSATAPARAPGHQEELIRAVAAPANPSWW